MYFWLYFVLLFGDCWWKLWNDFNWITLKNTLEGSHHWILRFFMVVPGRLQILSFSISTRLNEKCTTMSLLVLRQGGSSLNRPQILWGAPLPYTNQHPTWNKTDCKIASHIKQACAAGVRLEVALLAAGQIELQVVAFPSWAAAFPSLVVAFPSWAAAFPSWVVAFPSWVVAFPSLVVAFPSWVVAFPSLVVAFPFLAWVAFASLASPAFASPALIACQGLP